MTAINRGSCFFCGADVGDDDWDEIGDNRVWVCNESECNRELRNEQRGAEEDCFERARADNFARY